MRKCLKIRVQYIIVLSTNNSSILLTYQVTCQVMHRMEGNRGLLHEQLCTHQLPTVQVHPGTPMSLCDGKWPAATAPLDPDSLIPPTPETRGIIKQLIDICSS